MQLDRNGRTLEYDVTGSGAEVVVFIPALGATRAMWEPQLPAFAPLYTVVTYDPAGHDAATIWDRQPSLGDLADDLLALLDATHARRAHLVGLSMGGMIAQEFAIRYPDRPITVTLASTTSQYPDEARRTMEQRAQQVERTGMGAIVQGRIDAWLTPDFRRAHPDVVASVRRMLESADPNAYAQAARAVARVNTTDRLPEIGCPALILVGAEDPTLPADSATVLAAHVRNARVERIPHTSHLCNVEDPEAFSMQVLNFMGQVVAATSGEPGVPGLPQHGAERPASGPPR